MIIAFLAERSESGVRAEWLFTFHFLSSPFVYDDRCSPVGRQSVGSWDSSSHFFSRIEDGPSTLFAA